jgi:hypothetical protein
MLTPRTARCCSSKQDKPWFEAHPHILGRLLDRLSQRVTVQRSNFHALAHVNRPEIGRHQTRVEIGAHQHKLRTLIGGAQRPQCSDEAVLLVDIDQAKELLELVDHEQQALRPEDAPQAVPPVRALAVRDRPRAPGPALLSAGRQGVAHARARNPWETRCFRLNAAKARRFFCDNPICPQRTFCERLPQLAAAGARRTARLRTEQRRLALDVGGEAGARLAQRQGMPVCPATLLRLARRDPPPAAPTPRVLGVDDFSLRKRQVFGTILVDLSNRKVRKRASNASTVRRGVAGGAPGGV